MLKYFVEANNVKAEFLAARADLLALQDIAKFLKIPFSDTAKCALFLADGEPVIAVLLGSQKISLQKLKDCCNAVDIHAASEEEVEDIAGYPAESLPPISVYGVKTLLEKKLFEKEFVFCAAGEPGSAMKISPQQIQEFAENCSVEEFGE